MPSIRTGNVWKVDSLRRSIYTRVPPRRIEIRFHANNNNDETMSIEMIHPRARDYDERKLINLSMAKPGSICARDFPKEGKKMKNRFRYIRSAGYEALSMAPKKINPDAPVAESHFSSCLQAENVGQSRIYTRARFRSRLTASCG